MRAEMLSDLQCSVQPVALQEGCNATAAPGLDVWQWQQRAIEMPSQETPYLYVVVKGQLRLYTPSGIMDYCAGQYSVSKIDTPISGTVLEFADDKTFAAISIGFASSEVIEAALAMDNALIMDIAENGLDSVTQEEADNAVLQVVTRLLRATKQRSWSACLYRLLRRELFYYLLCGSSGRQLLQSIAGSGTSGVKDIYAANSWIKENFRKSFTVEELAVAQHMSVSLFHQKFKTAVGMGPLQCQKRLRLTEARRLMVDEAKNVTEAALDVGYESVSQFIRDYRKMFGAAPKEDVLMLQRSLKK